MVHIRTVQTEPILCDNYTISVSCDDHMINTTSNCVYGGIITS